MVWMIIMIIYVIRSCQIFFLFIILSVLFIYLLYLFYGCLIIYLCFVNLTYFNDWKDRVKPHSKDREEWWWQWLIAWYQQSWAWAVFFLKLVLHAMCSEFFFLLSMNGRSAFSGIPKYISEYTIWRNKSWVSTHVTLIVIHKWLFKIRYYTNYYQPDPD